MLQSLLHLRTWARLGLGACLVAAGLAGSGSADPSSLFAAVDLCATLPARWIPA